MIQPKLRKLGDPELRTALTYVLTSAMKLGKVEKLMARLSLKVQPSQLEELVACCNLPSSKKESIRSPITLLITLRKRSKSVEEFISTLQRSFDGLDNVYDLSELLKRFRRLYPNFSQPESIEEPPQSVTPHRPTEAQSMAFNKCLVRISNELTYPHLELMVQLSPTPDGQKEYLVTGIKLFEEMKRHGCISENDTELLDDFFRVLKLTTPASLLEDYKRVYPLIHYVDQPTAPVLGIQSHYPSGNWDSGLSHPSLEEQTPSQEQQGYLPPSSSHTPPTLSHIKHPTSYQKSHQASADDNNPATRTAGPHMSPMESFKPFGSAQQMFRVNRSNSNSMNEPVYVHPRLNGSPSNYGNNDIYPRPNQAEQSVNKEGLIPNVTPSAPPAHLHAASKGTLLAEKFPNKVLLKAQPPQSMPSCRQTVSPTSFEQPPDHSGDTETSNLSSYCPTDPTGPPSNRCCVTPHSVNEQPSEPTESSKQRTPTVSQEKAVVQPESQSAGSVPISHLMAISGRNEKLSGVPKQSNVVMSRNTAFGAAGTNPVESINLPVEESNMTPRGRIAKLTTGERPHKVTPYSSSAKVAQETTPSSRAKRTRSHQDEESSDDETGSTKHRRTEGVTTRSAAAKNDQSFISRWFGGWWVGSNDKPAEDEYSDSEEYQSAESEPDS